MIRKGAAIIAFCVAAYFAHEYAIEILESTGSDPTEYWTETGQKAFRIIISGGAGLIAAAGAYFLLNLFARAD